MVGDQLSGVAVGTMASQAEDRESILCVKFPIRTAPAWELRPKSSHLGRRLSPVGRIYVKTLQRAFSQRRHCDMTVEQVVCIHPLTSRLLLLLVIHDDHLHDLSVAAEEHAQVGLGDVRRQTAQEHLGIAAAALRLLQRARVARLRVDGSAGVTSRSN